MQNPCSTSNNETIHSYPFGMGMPTRSWSVSGENYLYGFQGQESDDEIYGNNNAYSFEYRIADPILGRFFSIDPLTKQYPFISPYAFSENDVIRSVELEGKEKYIVINDYSDGDLISTTVIRVINSKSILQNIKLKNTETGKDYSHNDVLVVDRFGPIMFGTSRKGLTKREDKIIKNTKTTYIQMGGNLVNFQMPLGKNPIIKGDLMENDNFSRLKNKQDYNTMRANFFQGSTTVDEVYNDIKNLQDVASISDAYEGTVNVTDINIYFKDEESLTKYSSGLIEKLSNDFKGAKINSSIYAISEKLINDQNKNENKSFDNVISVSFKVSPK